MKYRFIAPTVSSSNEDTMESYIFYSQIRDTDMDLTATVQLASEVSTYDLGNIQKDEKGNFYNVVELTSGRPYILSITNNGNTNVNSGSIYAYRYAEANGGEPIRIGGMNEQNEALVINSAAGEETWVSYTVEEDGIYTFTASVADDTSGNIHLYKLEDSQLIQLPKNNSYGSYFSKGSDGKIEGINLNEGDNILLRIYQSGHQALSCNVEAKWEVWEITSVEEGSNTKEVVTDSSGTEGKVWLNFGEGIEAGTYKITSNTYSTALKLYKNEQEISNPESTDQQSDAAVTFEYKPNENDTYQLGITTSASSVTLTITKEEATETPGDGEGDNETGDGGGSDTGNGDNNGSEGGTENGGEAGGNDGDTENGGEAGDNGGTDGDTDAGENGGTTGNNDSSTNG